METLTADLETGAGDSSFSSSPSTPTDTQASPAGSLDAMLDQALSDDTPSGEQQTTEPPAGDRGDGRDPKGRFAAKPTEGEPASPAAPEAAKPAADAAQPAPFRFRSMGKTHDVDGATLDASGNLTIPAAKVADVQQAFNALEMAKGSYMPALESRNQRIAQLTKELDEAKQSTSATDAQAAKLVEFFTAAANEPDDEKALGMLWQIRAQFPVLLANAKAAHFEALAKRGIPNTQPAAPTERPVSSQHATPSAHDARAYTAEVVEQWKTQSEFRDIPADTWKQVETKVAKTPFAYLRPATAADATAHQGIVEGQLVLDTDLLFADLTQHREQRETAQRQAELAARNATRTQATITAPPSAGGTQAPPKAQGQPKNKTLEARIDAALDLED